MTLAFAPVSRSRLGRAVREARDLSKCGHRARHRPRKDGLGMGVQAIFAREDLAEAPEFSPLKILLGDAGGLLLAPTQRRLADSGQGVSP